MIAGAAMLVAMALDGWLGWPAPLFRRMGHPVTWLGRLIAALDRRWNAGDARRAKGAAAAVLVISVAAGAGWAVQAALPGGWPGAVLTGLLAWPLVAMRSMHDHVQAVWRPLARGDLAGARQAVSMIVGRDPARLDEAGVARAALESLAENTSDGIVAPLFWGALLGLPGMAVYKAVNTLDSMIGHRTPRHEAFGWAAARIDDGANLIPAQMGAQGAEAAGLGIVPAIGIAGACVTLAIRPERLAILPAHQQAAGDLGPLTVAERIYMGNELSFRLEGAAVPLHVTLPRGGLRGAQDFAPGDTVCLRPEPGAIRVLAS